MSDSRRKREQRPLNAHSLRSPVVFEERVKPVNDSPGLGQLFRHCWLDDGNVTRPVRIGTAYHQKVLGTIQLSVRQPLPLMNSTVTTEMDFSQPNPTHQMPDPIQLTAVVDIDNASASNRMLYDSWKTSSVLSLYSATVLQCTTVWCCHKSLSICYETIIILDFWRKKNRTQPNATHK